jgi:hypothetical protein
MLLRWKRYVAVETHCSLAHERQCFEEPVRRRLKCLGIAANDCGGQPRRILTLRELLEVAIIPVSTPNQVYI